MRPTSVIAIVGFVLLGLLAVALAVMQMPARLRVAVGPEEFDHARLMAAFARKLNADRAPVRLTLIRKPDFAAQAAAVDSGEADLAVVRSDLMPRHALTVAVLHELPVVFAVTGNARVRDVADLAGKRVGVLRGSAENLALLDTVLKQAGVERERVERLPLAPEHLAAQLAEHPVDVVMPISPMLGAARDRNEQVLHKGARGVPVFGVGEAEAIARRDPSLAVIEVPRGALLSWPPVPREPLTTLAVTHRLVARTELSSQVVADVTRLLFTSRVAMADDVPSAKAIHAPQTDTGEALGAALPLHPGAAAYLSGDQQTFFDRYGDLFYIGGMLVTTLFSGVGALLSFLLARQRRNAAQFTRQLLDLLARARRAPDQAELQAVEKDADELLALAFRRVSSGAIGSEQFDTFATVNDSVHQAIARRARQLQHQVAATGPEGADS